MERPFKLEQWSRDYARVIRTILETATPADAHAEFGRVVKHRPRGIRWGGERWCCGNIRAPIIVMRTAKAVR